MWQEFEDSHVTRSYAGTCTTCYNAVPLPIKCICPWYPAFAQFDHSSRQISVDKRIVFPTDSAPIAWCQAKNVDIQTVRRQYQVKVLHALAGAL